MQQTASARQAECLAVIMMLESTAHIYNFGYTWATRDLTHESMCGILHINDVDHKPTWATHGLHMNLHILHV